MIDERRPDSVVIAQLQSVLRNAPPLRLAVLFGSAAVGRNRSDSDIDVAILASESELDDRDELALVRQLTLTVKREVDLVRLENASTILKWQVATKGVPLVEGIPGEFARFQARAASEYIEYAPAHTYHGEVFRRRLMEYKPTR